MNYDNANHLAIVNQGMVKLVLGEMPELVEQLTQTTELEVPQLRWSDIQGFNLLELMTSERSGAPRAG